MKQCYRCYKINPGKIHTCTPGIRKHNGKILVEKFKRQYLNEFNKGNDNRD